MRRSYPAHVEDGLRAGARLEYWTLAWMATVIPLMALTVGSSQAMKTAWIEDMLGLIPPTVFLVSTRIERRQPTRRFPRGFHRVNSLAFVISATTLAAMGGYLAIEAIATLAMAEHPTIGTVRLFGRDIWQGWLMIAALTWSSVPAIFLGRMKLPIARRIHDKVLHSDAAMQKADWTSAAAAMVGVIGIGLGLWWADAMAALVIAVGILRDGITELRSATAELVDGAPRALEDDSVSTEAEALERRLLELYPGGEVRLRESGRFFEAQMLGVDPPGDPIDLDSIWPGEADRAWRFSQLSFVPSPADASA